MVDLWLAVSSHIDLSLADPSWADPSHAVPAQADLQQAVLLTAVQSLADLSQVYYTLAVAHPLHHNVDFQGEPIVQDDPGQDILLSDQVLYCEGSAEHAFQERKESDGQ